MENFKTIISKLRKERNLSQEVFASDIGVSKSTVAMWETGKRLPSKNKYEELADYFNVDIDYLYGRTETRKKVHFDNDGNAYYSGTLLPDELTQKDEKDIAKRLEATLSDLENQQASLMFSGKPLDDETKELLKVSLENSIRIAKINAKKKFTPKKYKKD